MLAGLPALAQDSAHPMLALIAPMLGGAGRRPRGRAPPAWTALAPTPTRGFARPGCWSAGIWRSAPVTSKPAAADLADGYGSFEDLGDRFGDHGEPERPGRGGDGGAASPPRRSARWRRPGRTPSTGVAGHWARPSACRWAGPARRPVTSPGPRGDRAARVRFAERIGELDDAPQGYVHLSELARETGDLAEARVMLAAGRADRRAAPAAAGHGVRGRDDLHQARLRRRAGRRPGRRGHDWHRQGPGRAERRRW